MDCTEFRTSDSDPIEVNWLQGLENLLLPGNGKIGLTFAPGKKGPSYHGTDWYRDLDQDLERLRSEFHTSLLVTLIEKWEMDRYQIPNLLERARDFDIQVIHEPVVDLNPPTLEQAERVTRLAVETARKGKNVVLHCLGGRGRAGTMGACCYLALGFDPNQAFHMVRACREGAVETPSQKQFLLKFQSLTKIA